MSERQVEQEAQKRDAMGCLLVSNNYGHIDFDKYCYVQTIGVRPRKDNPTATEAFVEKIEKIDDIVREAAKTVGLNVALEQIAKGLVSPDAYIDDGTGFVDDVNTPQFRGDIAAAVAQNAAVNKVIKKEYGDDVTPENLKEYVDKKIAAAIAGQNKPEGGNE